MDDTTSCQTAMDRLETLLKSYRGGSKHLPLLEDLFDTTFDPSVRFDLNGRSYRRNFLWHQETQNFKRRRSVDEIAMEILDAETFRYAFRIRETTLDDEASSCASSGSSRSSSFKNSTNTSRFHALATVRDGKISRIKAMTGSAYSGLFRSNLRFATDQAEAVAAEEDSTQRKRRKSKPSDFRVRRGVVHQLVTLVRI